MVKEVFATIYKHQNLLRDSEKYCAANNLDLPILEILSFMFADNLPQYREDTWEIEPLPQKTTCRSNNYLSESIAITGKNLTMLCSDIFTNFMK